MLQQRNGLTGLLGPGRWLSIALLAVAVFLLFTQLASAQQPSTPPSLSAPALTAQSSDNEVDLSTNRQCRPEFVGLTHLR